MIAVTPQHQVKGFFHQPPEEGTNQNCIFWFNGQLDNNGMAKITSWSTQVLPGNVQFKEQQIEITLPHGQQHAGCMNTLLPEIETGEIWSLTDTTNWVDLVTITQEKARMYREHDIHSKSPGYVVKGDTLGLLQRKADWSQVEYINDAGKRLTGWIKNSDYQSLSSSDASAKAK